MIELLKEKSYTTKDPKLQLFKHAILFDKFRLPKFSSVVIASKPKEYETSIFVGFNNGSILSLKLSKQKSLFLKYEEFSILKCKEEFKHRGPVFALISEIIDGVSVLFSGGVDGTIKFWNTELEDQKQFNYVTTIFGHKGTVLALAFCKTKNILISSSTDMTIKCWKIKDNFDKILNPFFFCISTIRDFNLRKKMEDEKPFWINSLSIKETDIIELYAGDTKGRIHFYHYADSSYMKIRENESRFADNNKKDLNKKFVLDTFNHIRTATNHARTIIKVVHSIFDSIIYSIGFDNQLIGYNVKSDTKNLSIANSGIKSHFSCLSINYFTQELIVGDDKGGLSFVKIFNKSEIKLRVNSQKIIFVQNIEIFNDQEHVLVVTEDSIDIYRIKRETKIVNVQYHEAEIIKLFVEEPIYVDEKIIEDAK